MHLLIYKVMKFFSKYSLEARAFPTLVGLLPFYILQYVYLKDLIPFEVFAVNIVGNISLSLVLLYFVSEFLVRYPSMLFEDKIFNKKNNFPTTNFLLFNNKEYTENRKIQIRERLKKDFSIELLNKADELKDEKEARMRIKEAVGLIISVVKGGHLVIKQNIAYGFVRNLWSASILGVVFSAALIVFSFGNSLCLYNISAILLILYLVYLLFGKLIVIYFGENYARRLINEYLVGSYEKK